MRILHYFLGFHRAGGLNRYAADLASAQAESGHEVFALFPEGSLLPRRRAALHSRRMRNSIACFALLNGRPVPLLEGVRDPDMLLNKSANRLSEKEIHRFLDRIRPDILHVHSWMGFPEEILPELKRRQVALVFTTHDYYALCPRVNFIDETGSLCMTPENEKCSRCNRNAPGERFLSLRNAPFVLHCKSWLQPLLAMRARKKSCLEPVTRKNFCAGSAVVKNYSRLVERQIQLLRECDRIHFNSDATRNVYLRFIPDLRGGTIPIAHAGIVDRRRSRTVNREQVRLCFIGSEAPYKGLPMLEHALRELEKTGLRNWTLDVWGTPRKDSTTVACADAPRIRRRGMFFPEDRQRVFDDADLLIVPSICHETFGFVVAEALSFGLPVLCSDMVGAKILLEPGMVFRGQDGLLAALRRILGDPAELNSVNAGICAAQSILTMKEHEKAILSLYADARASLRKNQNAE